MKIPVYLALTLMPLLTVTAGDKCGRQASATQSCSHAVKAKDFKGLDGCGILLVLDNGKKLLATNMNDFEIKWTDGSSYRVDYEILEDMMSICMAENHTVKLTCAEPALVPKGQGMKCDTIIDPYRVEWSAKVMMDLDPRRVVEMYIDDQLCYFYPGQTERRIYKCTGELLCKSTSVDPDACRAVMSRAERIRVMYVVNE